MEKRGTDLALCYCRVVTNGCVNRHTCSAEGHVAGLVVPVVLADWKHGQLRCHWSLLVSSLAAPQAAVAGAFVVLRVCPGPHLRVSPCTPAQLRTADQAILPRPRGSARGGSVPRAARSYSTPRTSLSRTSRRFISLQCPRRPARPRQTRPEPAAPDTGRDKLDQVAVPGAP